MQKQCSAQSGSFKNIAGSRTVTTGCNDLALMITKQPIAVFVDGKNFQLYRSGIYSNCGTSPNVGLLLTGMTDSYWRLKNSLGSTWG